MPLYASDGFENGDLNDRPAPPLHPPATATAIAAATEHGGQPQPPPPPLTQEQLERLRPAPIFFKDAESFWNWKPTIRESKITGPPMPLLYPHPSGPQRMPMLDRGGQRYGPNGEVYMLPGDTPDMFKCDVCGKPGHRWSSCAYKSKFPPDGHIARPDLYEVICWCGSLNISPDPPRKCNKCSNGGDALMLRSKKPPYKPPSQPESRPDIYNSIPRQSYVPFFRPDEPPSQPPTLSRDDLMF